MENSTTRQYLRDDPFEKRCEVINSSIDELLMSMAAANVPEFHRSMYDGPLRQTLILIEKHRDDPVNDVLGGLVQTAVAMLSNPVYNFAKDSLNSDTAEPMAVAVRASTIAGSVMEKMGEGMSDAIGRSISSELMASRRAATDEDCDCPACKAARAAQDPTSLH